MKRRIFGLQNEYGLTCTLNGQRRLSPDNVARYLFEEVIPGARNANVFLENGARLYLDTGFHPEYATPECDDVAELVIHDKAGERIVEDLLHQAEKRLREDGISGNILLFKNNTDSAGNSYGCHENYLVSRDVSFQRLAEALIPFFVTRQIFAGAGKVLQTPRGFHYCLSQRAQHICQEISGATTKDVLARWTDVLTKLESDALQLGRELDWVIKRQLIDNFMNRHRLSWRDPKVSLLDLQYHDIRPDKGVYYRMIANDHVDRITDDETIEQAKHVPPQTTRARLRGEFIRQANLKGKDYRVDWVYLKLNDPERETILCKDPFQSHDERVERLIRSF